MILPPTALPCIERTARESGPRHSGFVRLRKAFAAPRVHVAQRELPLMGGAERLPETDLHRSGRGHRTRASRFASGQDSEETSRARSTASRTTRDEGTRGRATVAAITDGTSFRVALAASFDECGPGSSRSRSTEGLAVAGAADQRQGA